MFNVLPTAPLNRLQVTDGLLLTAERWRVAHSYHRQRQNLHFQASYQAGIVAGLGVAPVAAPAQVAAQYRDGRWLQVQPGIAIDREGNPIVVPRPITYRIAAEPETEPLQVYLVVSFVDPDSLEQQDSTYVVQETFRLEEKVSPPDATEVELCRIWLAPGEVQVRSPRDSFAPLANELDLRHRPWIQPRPKGELRLGYLTLSPHPTPAIEAALGGLIAALPGLYPALQAHPDVGHLPLRNGGTAAGLSETFAAYDLLYLPYGDSQQLQVAEVQALQAYLETGGVVLIEAPARGTEMDRLLRVWSEVMQALAKGNPLTDADAVYEELQLEQVEMERCIALELQTLMSALAPLFITDDAGTATAQNGLLHPQHPLRIHPFRFGMFPLFRGTPLALFNWGGVVVGIEGLSAAWGGTATLFMPRDAIRSAQELGINLLYFAWQRRQWAQCLTPTTPPPPPPPPSRSPRLDAIFDQLDR